MIVCFDYNTNRNFMNQWDFVLCNFKPAEIYIRGDEKTSFISNPLKSATFIQSYDELPDKPKIIMAPEYGRHVQGVLPLSEFEHPEDAIYIFGSDSAIMEKFDFDMSVKVETDTKDDMYSFVAYAVVAWDRRMKLGNC